MTFRKSYPFTLCHCIFFKSCLPEYSKYSIIPPLVEREKALKDREVTSIIVSFKLWAVRRDKIDHELDQITCWSDKSWR